ncbi:MAG: hypothetical protein ABIS29_14375 [Vicinamibacterales bacterium]
MTIDIDLSGANLDKRPRDPSWIVPGLGIPAGEVRRAVDALYARIGGPRRKPGTFTAPLRPWRGVRYFLLAFLIGLLALYLGWLSRDIDLDGTPGWVGFGGAGLAVAFYLGMRGAVCFRPKAETLIAFDGRPPVIYLRSFRDDEAMVARPVRLTLEAIRWKYLVNEYTRAGLFRVMFQHGRLRLEQTVEEELSAIGPFVAIGEPNERHPDFGATRAYFEGDDAQWRDAVKSWIESAAMVVVVPGATEGLAWELAKIQDGGIAHKLVLIFPPERAANRTKRLSALAAMLKDPHWRDAISTSARTDFLAVFSTSRGDLVRVYSKTPRVADVEFAAELALYGLFCIDGPAQAGHYVRASGVRS